MSASKLKELEAQYTAQQKKAPEPKSASIVDRLKDFGSWVLGAIVTALDAPANFLRAKAQEAANEAQKRYEQLRRENPNQLTVKTPQDVKAFFEMKDYGRKAVAYGFFAGVASIISPSAWADTLRFVYGAGKGAVGTAASAARDPAGTLRKVKEGVMKAPDLIAGAAKSFIDRPFHAGATIAELAGSIATPIPFASKVPVTVTRTFKTDVTALKAFSSTGDYLPLAKADPHKLSKIDPLWGWGFTWGHRWLEDYGYYSQLIPIKLNLDLTLKDPRDINDVMRLQPHKLEAPEPRGTLFVLEGKLEPRGLPKIVIGRPKDSTLFAGTDNKFLYFHKEAGLGSLSIRAGLAEDHLLRLQALDLEAGLGGGKFRSIGFVGEFLPDKAASWRQVMENRLASLSKSTEPKAIKEELAQAKLEFENTFTQLALETRFSQALNDPAKGVSKAKDLLSKFEAKGGVILAGELREPDMIVHISRSMEELTGYRPRTYVKTQLSEKPIVKEGDVWGLGVKTTVIEDKVKDVTELYVVGPEKKIEKYIPRLKDEDALAAPSGPRVLKKQLEKVDIEPKAKQVEELRKVEEGAAARVKQELLQKVDELEELKVKQAEIEVPLARLEVPAPRVPRTTSQAVEAAVESGLKNVFKEPGLVPQKETIPTEIPLAKAMEDLAQGLKVKQVELKKVEAGQKLVYKDELELKEVEVPLARLEVPAPRLPRLTSQAVEAAVESSPFTLPDGLRNVFKEEIKSGLVPRKETIPEDPLASFSGRAMEDLAQGLKVKQVEEPRRVEKGSTRVQELQGVEKTDELEGLKLMEVELPVTRLEVPVLPRLSQDVNTSLVLPPTLRDIVKEKAKSGLVPRKETIPIAEEHLRLGGQLDLIQPRAAVELMVSESEILGLRNVVKPGLKKPEELMEVELPITRLEIPVMPRLDVDVASNTASVLPPTLREIVKEEVKTRLEKPKRETIPAREQLRLEEQLDVAEGLMVAELELPHLKNIVKEMPRKEARKAGRAVEEQLSVLEGQLDLLKPIFSEGILGSVKEGTRVREAPRVGAVELMAPELGLIAEAGTMARSLSRSALKARLKEYMAPHFGLIDLEVAEPGLVAARGARSAPRASWRTREVSSFTPRLTPAEAELLSAVDYSIPLLRGPLHDLWPAKGKTDTAVKTASGIDPMIPRVGIQMKEFRMSFDEPFEHFEDEGRKRREKQEKGKRGGKIKAREYMLPEFLSGLSFKHGF